MKGIEFKYIDGTTESYDPISEFKIGLYHYIFYVGGYNYQIPIDNVLELREYPLCQVCGYEVYSDGCRRCIEDEELKLLRNEK